MPASLWSQLNPTQQASVRTTIKRYVTDVKEPDWNVYAEYKLHPEQLVALSDTEFKNLCDGFFGGKADEMALLRAMTKQKQAALSDSVAQRRRAADSGVIDYSLGPSKDTLISAIRAFDPNFKADNARNNRRLMWLSQAMAEKVMRGEIDESTVKSAPAMEHEIAKIWYTDLYSGNGELKFNALNVEVSDLPNRGQTDAYRMIESLTKSRLGITREPDERELDQTLFLLLHVKNPDFKLTPNNLPTLDTDVYNAACDQLGVRRGTQTPEVYRQYLINRLYGLTPTARGKSLNDAMLRGLEDFTDG